MVQHSARLEGSVDSLIISEFAISSAKTVDAGAEDSDSEEVPPTVPEESRVEEVVVKWSSVEDWRGDGGEFFHCWSSPSSVGGSKFQLSQWLFKALQQTVFVIYLPESSHFGIRVLVCSRTFCSQQEPLFQVAARDNRGVEGSRTCSFVLPDSGVNCLAPDYIKVGSKALLAAKGPWMTCGHIEPAGERILPSYRPDASVDHSYQFWLFQITHVHSTL